MEVVEGRMTRPVDSAVKERCHYGRRAVYDENDGNRECLRSARNTSVSGKLVTAIVGIRVR